MNVLADFHHADLWWSLDALFQKRLGWKLYRPYGMAWYDEGYLRLYGDLAKEDPSRYLAKMYLEDTVYDYKNGTGIGQETLNGCRDYPSFNLLTLEEAMDTQLDIIICSVNENEKPFYSLKETHPNAKFIRQAGNHGDNFTDPAMYPNLLASALSPYQMFQGHKLLYRQEFDMNLFRYEEPTQFKNIYNFQGGMEHKEPTRQLWLDLKHELRDMNFKTYGVGNDDGKIYPKRDFVSKMLESSLIFNVKDWDGYGHVVHNAMALGRPVIIRKDDYRDKIANDLLIDGMTCLTVDDNLPQKIREVCVPEVLTQMSKICRTRFTQTVNFDNEFEKVKQFLEELV